MDSPYGAGMDPTPYIFLAYAIGTFGLFGFGSYIFWERRKLQRLAAALNEDQEKDRKE